MKKFFDDQGSVSVVTLAILVLLIFMFSAIGFGTRMAHEYRLTQQAADLSALAAATVISTESSQPCVVAGEIAASNRAHLDSCSVLIGAVQVTVRSKSLGFVKATARAGIF